MADIAYVTGDEELTSTYWMLPARNKQWVLDILSGLLTPPTLLINWEQGGTATPEQGQTYFSQILNGLRPMALVPGMLIDHVGVTLPDGFLWCNGDTYSRADYPELYANIASVYVIDANHFRVPDFREKFAKGGSFTNVGTEGGEAEVTLDVGQMPSHNHTDIGHTHADGIAIPTLIAIGAGVPAASAVPSVSVTGVGNANISTTGGDQSHNNIPPFIQCPKIIYTGRF